MREDVAVADWWQLSGRSQQDLRGNELLMQTEVEMAGLMMVVLTSRVYISEESLYHFVIIAVAFLFEKWGHFMSTFICY
jgi:hypothetical protein